jgi:hypothetical protein
VDEQKHTLQKLEISLGHLAAEWRGSFNDPEIQDSIVRQYHVAVQRLYELGWNEIIDIESELPEELMPREYLDLNPPFYSPNVNMRWDK